MRYLRFLYIIIYIFSKKELENQSNQTSSSESPRTPRHIIGWISPSSLAKILIFLKEAPRIGSSSKPSIKIGSIKDFSPTPLEETPERVRSSKCKPRISVRQPAPSPSLLKPMRVRRVMLESSLSLISTSLTYPPLLSGEMKLYPTKPWFRSKKPP